jgi:hypothetical protein
MRTLRPDPREPLTWSGRRDSNPRPPPWQGDTGRPDSSGPVRFRSSQQVRAMMVDWAEWVGTGQDERSVTQSVTRRGSSDACHKGNEFAPVPADRRPDRRVARGVAPRSHRLIGVEVNATWAIGISLAALAFSVYSWVRGFSITRRLAAIEVDRRGEELAAKASASVSARIRKDPVPGSDIHLHAKLVIHNAGPARAEGTMLEFVNPEDAILPDSYLEKWFPWSLDAGEDHEITATSATTRRQSSRRGSCGPTISATTRRWRI